MTCNQHQERILEYDQLTVGERQSVDAHLQVCPHCREVAREWRALDKALAQQLQAPVVSANFDARLHQRIAREPAARSETDLAERRRALEAEYAASRQRPRRWIPQLLDVLGCGVAGGLGGWLLLVLLTHLNAAWATSPTLTGTKTLIISSAAGMLVAFGLAVLVFCRSIRLTVLR